MTKHDFASIIFKLLGFYLLANNLAVSLVSIIPYLVSSQQSDVLSKYVIIIPILSYMFLGLVFIIFAEFFASLIIKENEDDKINFNITADDLQRVLFSYLGLYFVTLSLPRLVSIAINIFTFDKQVNYLSPKVTGDLAGGIIQVILGFGIFLGSKGLVELLKILRYSGKSNSEDK